MRTLEERLLMPGYDVRVVSVGSDGIAVTTKAGDVDVSADIANKIYVSR